MSVSVIMDLFDKYIGAILNYSCEVWGFHNARDVEQVHFSFCKRVLGVKKTTQNDFVYGELKRVLMSIERYIRVLNYWFKIVSGEKISIGICGVPRGFNEYWRFMQIFMVQIRKNNVVSIWVWRCLVQSRSWKCCCVLQMFSSKC